MKTLFEDILCELTELVENEYFLRHNLFTENEKSQIRKTAARLSTIQKLVDDLDLYFKGGMDDDC